MRTDLVRIWMRQLFASVGQVAEPSYRYILTISGTSFMGYHNY